SEFSSPLDEIEVGEWVVWTEAGVLTTLPILVVKRIGSSPVFTTGFSNSSRYSLYTSRINSEFSVFMRASLICPSRPGITFRTRARFQYERLLILSSSRTI
ncbi:hypothetical protein NPIL_162851, partial [Nephila pilipes]